MAVGEGITVSVREAGTGTPVIALHGGPGFRDYVAADLEPLASSFRLISYDQRGSGHSTVVTDPTRLTATAFVADLDRVRESVGVARVTLLGHSWGAGLAALYAIAHPDRVERLLLVGPMPPRAEPYMTVFSETLQSRFTDGDRAAMAEASARRQQAADADAPDACRAYYAVFIKGYLHNPTAAARMRGDLCAAPAAALRNFSNINRSIMGSLGAFDLRPQLAAIRVPTLIIHGVSDPIPMASAREWAASVPDGRLLVVDRSGHFPFVERPDAFFPVATAFLKGEWPPAARRVETTLEEEVKAANQAIIAAGLRGDQQAFARLVADELQWIRATGDVLDKAEFTKTINPGIGRSQRTFTDESVAVYGDVALLVCRSDFISQGQNRAERVLRAFIRRDGRWLLLRHAATPLP